MMTRMLLTGFSLWLAGTIAIRFFGQYLFIPNQAVHTLLLFAISFISMAFLVRRICRAFRVPSHQWTQAAIFLLTPTLLLDPFSSAFFPSLFPNIAVAAGGVFGGWLLICCSGALLGTVINRKQMRIGDEA